MYEDWLETHAQQVCSSLISCVKNYCYGKGKNLSTTVLKMLGEISTKITAVNTRMVNALCLLLALDSERGWSDIQLDSADIPDCGENNMFP